MTETLRIDTGLVLDAGGRLQTIAGAIPAPPSAVRPAGADALSTAIAGKIAEVVDPAIAQLPITKEDLTRYAQNVVSAANTYDTVDRQIAEEILERLRGLDSIQPMEGGSGGEGSGTGGAGAGAPAAGASTAAGTGASPAASQSADAAQQAGQMGQMMQMPMQMAQQAAQIPMQLAGMAAAIPGAMMQGVQSALQQVGQVSEMTGEEKPEDGVLAEEVDEKRAGESTDSAPDRAAPGDSAGERAPEPQQQEPRPETPTAPKPAPTRPAESPEIAL